jgi:hypothetical protein
MDKVRIKEAIRRMDKCKCDRCQKYKQELEKQLKAEENVKPIEKPKPPEAE